MQTLTPNHDSLVFKMDREHLGHLALMKSKHKCSFEKKSNKRCNIRVSHASASAFVWCVRLTACLGHSWSSLSRVESLTSACEIVGVAERFAEILEVRFDNSLFLL